MKKTRKLYRIIHDHSCTVGWGESQKEAIEEFKRKHFYNCAREFHQLMIEVEKNPMTMNSNNAENYLLIGLGKVFENDELTCEWFEEEWQQHSEDWFQLSRGKWYPKYQIKITSLEYNPKHRVNMTEYAKLHKRVLNSN